MAAKRSPSGDKSPPPGKDDEGEDSWDRFCSLRLDVGADQLAKDLSLVDEAMGMECKM
jgi:hypothetical protein